MGTTRTKTPARAWRKGDHQHPLLTEHPQYGSVDEAHVAAIEAAQRLDASYGAALGRWESAAADAHLAGTQPPPRPEAPTDGLRRELGERARLLAKRREQVVAEIADEVREELQSRSAEIFAEVRQLLALIEDLAAEHSSLATASQILAGHGAGVHLSCDRDTLIRHAQDDRPLFGISQATWENWRRSGLER